MAVIKVGDLVIQRRINCEVLGLVLLIKYGRSQMPKNEPDLLYEYAMVRWINGKQGFIKTSLLKKIT